MTDTSLAAISAETVERDYQRSEAALARAQRSALLAALIFLIEGVMLGVVVAYGINTDGEREYSHAPVPGVIGIGTVTVVTFMMVAILIYIAWPATRPRKSEGMNEYRDRLKQDESGPSISDAYDFSQRVYRRTAGVRVAVALLVAFAGGTLMILAAL